jgi:hypothetical protein
MSRKSEEPVGAKSTSGRGATAAGRSGSRSGNIGKVCQCSEKPFNINARLYDSLPNYQLDFTAKYQFIPKYHWFPFFV